MGERPKCFIAMKYGSPCIDPVFDIIEQAASQVGLSAFRSDQESGESRGLRGKIRNQIDGSLVFLCEATAPTWFVTYELSYAIERKPCIILRQQPPPDCIGEGESVNKLYGDLDIEQYSLRKKEERDRLREALVGRFTEVLKEMRDCAQTAIGHLRCQSGILYGASRVPDTYVRQMISWQGELQDERQAFHSWMTEALDRKPVALISPPGGGKSLLLTRFREWLSAKCAEPCPPMTTSQQMPHIVHQQSQVEIPRFCLQ